MADAEFTIGVTTELADHSDPVALAGVSEVAGGADGVDAVVRFPSHPGMTVLPLTRERIRRRNCPR